MDFETLLASLDNLVNSENIVDDLVSVRTLVESAKTEYDTLTERNTKLQETNSKLVSKIATTVTNTPKEEETPKVDISSLSFL